MAPPINPERPFRPEPPPAETRAHFQSTPWALQFFDDPSLQAFTDEAQTVKPQTTENTLIARTLATEDTIRAWQSFYKDPDSSTRSGQVLSIISLGSGVNGHEDTSHGGFVSVLHDEILGIAAQSYRPSDKTTMTAYLKVDYKKPMRTPGVVLCRSWLEKKEGRKIYVRGSIEDGDGNVLSLSEGLFIIVEIIKPRERL